METFPGSIPITRFSQNLSVLKTLQQNVHKNICNLNSSIHPSMQHTFILPSIHLLAICPSTHPSFYKPINQSIHPAILSSTHAPTQTSIHPPIPVCLSPSSFIPPSLLHPSLPTSLPQSIHASDIPISKSYLWAVRSIVGLWSIISMTVFIHKLMMVIPSKIV